MTIAAADALMAIFGLRRVELGHDELERMAEQLCDSRWGEGHWAMPGVKRSYWRRKAREILCGQVAQ